MSTNKALPLFICPKHETTQEKTSWLVLMQTNKHIRILKHKYSHCVCLSVLAVSFLPHSHMNIIYFQSQHGFCYSSKIKWLKCIYKIVGNLIHWAVLGEKKSCGIITVTLWWARWRLKSPASRLFTQSLVQAQNNEKQNIKTPRHWPLWGKFNGDRWIPRTNGR